MHNSGLAKAMGAVEGCVSPATVENENHAAGSETKVKGATMMRTILGRCFGTVVIFAAVLLIPRLEVRAADQQDNREVSKLLEDIKSQAADLQRDSEELESFTRSNTSWESHAEELNLIKDRINTIGKTIGKLQELRSSASPWQQEAIDRLIPVAQKLASNTTAAIEHLNKEPSRIHEPQYQQYIKSNAEAARNLAAMVRDFVEYGKTRTTLEAYERKLELPR
jgi:uncharacterized protein YbjQ (UPF0145 family)